MKYEELARKAFDDCGKYGDPFNYAAQERYSNFVPKPTLQGKRMLSTVLIKIIVSNQGKSEIPKFLELEDKVWKSETQEEVVSIIDEATKLLESIS